jgi:hypothetical protein
MIKHKGADCRTPTTSHFVLEKDKKVELTKAHKRTAIFKHGTHHEYIVDALLHRVEAKQDGSSARGPARPFPRTLLSAVLQLM